VISMDQVVAALKILPEGVEVDLNKLKEAIKGRLPTGVSVHKYEEEPIAFGLVALIAYVLMPEKESDIMNRVEEAIKSVDGVSEIEVVMIRRA